ncbi:hypothetical protein [Acidaminobacterium chupaoyuni]
MVRKWQRKTAMQTHHSGGALLFFTLLLVAGMAAGAYYAIKFPAKSIEPWQVRRGFRCFLFLFWRGLRFLLPIAIVAFFRIGVVAIPCLFVAKGVCDAVSITNLLLCYGKTGLAASLLAQSSLMFITTFAMLLLALPAYRMCGMLASVPKGNGVFLKLPPDRAYGFGVAASLLVLALFSFFGCFVFPFLWQTAVGLIG